MSITVIVREAGAELTRHALGTAPLFIGRRSENDIELPASSVSGRHAVLIAIDNVVGLRDIDSVNGTYLNGKRVRDGVKARPGDIIRIGPYELAVVEDAAVRDTIPSDPLPARDSAPPADPTNVGSEPAEPIETPAAANDDNRNNDDPHSPAPPTDPTNVGPESVEPAGTPDPDSATVNADIHLPASIADPAHAGPDPIQCLSAVNDDATDADGDPARPDSSAEPADPAEAGSEPAAEPRSVLSAVKQRLARLAARSASFSAKDGAEPPSGNQDDDSESASPGWTPSGELPDPDFSGDDAFAATYSESESDQAESAPGHSETVIEPVVRIPVDADFTAAIEARLKIQAAVEELVQTRAAMLATPGLPDSAKSELERQERELDKRPTAEQAKTLADKRRERAQADREKAAAAEREGRPPPPQPAPELVAAQELAYKQWECWIELETTLPELDQGARSTYAEEPVYQALAERGINADRLFALSSYTLALEGLNADTAAERESLREAIAQLEATAVKPKRGGLFGRKAAAVEEAPPPPSEDDPRQRDALLEMRQNGGAREYSWTEKQLIPLFWDVYRQLSLWWLGGDEAKELPPPARAFLRFGAVGLSPWYMGPSLAKILLDNARSDVETEWDASLAATHLMYADEAMYFAVERKCLPAPDEDLELTGRNSPEWKADRALRRSIGLECRRAAHEEILATLGERVVKQRELQAKAEEAASKVLHGAKDAKRIQREHLQKAQGHKIEAGKFQKVIEKINDEMMPKLKEQIEDCQASMAAGEFTITRPYLIEREVQCIRKIGRLLANLKERYLPWALRDNAKPGTDQFIDRASANNLILTVERRDPGLFLENLVPAKKKDQRVDLRFSPAILLLPSGGVQGYAWAPRTGPDYGRLAFPTLFNRSRMAEKAMTLMMSDFRFDTAKANAGMDVMTSDTFIAGLAKVRWDYRKKAKETRERAAIYNDLNDRMNFRRIYEIWIDSIMDQGKKLFFKNYQLYDEVMCKYFEMPEGITRLKK